MEVSTAAMELSPLAPFVGQLIEHTYDGGYIFLSFVVSFVGCWTALELLHLRTSAHGYYNWYLLIAAASTMGSVAIWSMHFIGNQAITMKVDGLHILYSPGFTAGSFFLPICGVGIAFYFFSVFENISIISMLVGGLTLGTAICGMHYMGNGGISNFTLSYSWRYMGTSAAIAIATSSVALGVFFYFKMKWTNVWQKRASCAIVLGAAVSGMHWVATVGTHYRLKTASFHSNEGLSKKATVWVTISLSVSACIGLLVIAALGQRSRLRTSDRAQQVVIASMTFDAEGRLMVTPNGLLPCQKITDSYVERSFQDVFDVYHEVFSWCFKASRCWSGMSDLIQSLREYLRKVDARRPSRARAFSDTTPFQGAYEVDFSTLFKAMFLVAASELADTLQEPLASIGVLFDGIMSTGTLRKSNLSTSSWFKSILPGKSRDISNAGRGSTPMPNLYGRGQVLFVIRQVTKPDSMRLQASGFRFAAVANIIEHLASSMEVTGEELKTQISLMRKQTNGDRMLRTGIYLGCFALRPLLHRGFDVLVSSDAKNMLPTVPLHITKLEQSQLDLLHHMDNWGIASCCRYLRKCLRASEEQDCLRQLLDGLEKLAAQIKAPFMEDARLVATPLEVSSHPNGFRRGHVTLIAFRVMANVHERTAISDGYEFSPLKIFLYQQYSYHNNQVFGRKLYREFAGMVETGLAKSQTTKTPQRFFSRTQRSHKLRESPPHLNKWPARVRSLYSVDLGTASVSSNDIFNDAIDRKNLVPAPSSLPLGRIQISNEVDIDIHDVESESVDAGMKNSGYSSQAGLDKEDESFAEKLLRIVVEEQKRGGR